MKQNQVYIASLLEGIQQSFPDFSYEKQFESIVLDDAKKYWEKASQYLNLGKIETEESPHYLSSIFEKIAQKEENYYSLKSLLLEETIFPRVATNLTGNQQKLWQEFQAKLNSVEIPSDSIDTFYYLLKKYASYIPLNKEYQYINLFEYLKMRAAFAQCLYDFEQGSPGEPKQFLMLCIDISGIQNFIYNIVSGKAAKSLKGRSFYLQLLMDSLIQKVIQQTGKATIGHVIYASGGKAYMLLPNLEEVKKQVRKLEQEVERKVYDVHKEKLYVLMDWIEFGHAEDNRMFVESSLQDRILEKKSQQGKAKKLEVSDLWIELGNKTTAKKQRKYKSLFTKGKDEKQEQNFCFNDFFEPIDEGFDTANTDARKSCQVTGELIHNFNKEENYLHTRNDDDIWVTKNVKKQAELGKSLKSSDYYITYQGKKDLKNTAKEKAIEPGNLEVYHYIKDENDFIQEYERLGKIASINYSLVKRINNTKFLEDMVQGKKASYGFIFYGGNQQAYLKDKDGNYINRKQEIVTKLDREEKEFEELAGIEDENDRGAKFHRLGVLRMDVDSLGGLFAERMQEVQSFPAYATLSAQLDLFFAGYLNVIRDGECYNEWVNILYSGGDDVFAVGRWDKIIDFAYDIQQQFKRFTNNQLTLSAGVALITSKYPVSKGAEMAGQAEKAAKDFKGQINGKDTVKNAICFFEEAVSWEQEFEAVRDLHFAIKEWLKASESGFSKSLMYKLFKFKQQKDEGLPDWKWLSAYYFTRLQKNNRYSQKIFEMLQQLFFCGIVKLKINDKTHEYKFTSERALDLLCIACRWAELKDRNKPKKEEKNENSCL